MLFCAALIGACASVPDEHADDEERISVFGTPDASALALLDYARQVQRLSQPGIARERGRLVATLASPETQLRMAILLADVRAPDLARAQSLLDGVLKSDAPDAQGLYPLARLLSGQYRERLRLEMQNEKLAQQLRETARRNEELQHKLDALAEIEQALPTRPASGRKQPGRAQ